MNKKQMLAATFGMMLVGPAMAQTDTMTNSATTTNSTMTAPAKDAVGANSMTGTTTASNAVSASDRSFVTGAAQGGMIEIQSSKVAKSTSKNDDILKFAKQMISDHKKADDQLKSIAKKLNISVPSKLDPEHQAEVDQLKKADKSDFDQKFVAVQDKAHNEAVNLFQTEADNGENAQLKAFAQKTLPVLQGHLSEVKALEAKMPPAATTGDMGTAK